MKYIVSIFFLTFALASCNPDHKKNDSSSNNENLVRQYFEYFNNHEWNKMAQLYTDTVAFKDPALGQGIVQQTRSQIIQKYTELSQMFPDVKDSVVRIYTSGPQHVIVEFFSTGTAADHSKFSLSICTIFTIENGLITKDFTYYDNFEQ